MNKNSKTLKRTLFTISGITGISVLSALFVIPNQACVNSSVNDSESKIINFSNNSLINLKSEIDNYLLSNKYSFDELDNKLTHDYKFLDQFKQLLVKLSNNLISLESIGEIKLSLRNGIIYLVIKSSDSYQYKATNSNNFLDELNSCIIFSTGLVYTSDAADDLTPGGGGGGGG
ncbi:MAG: hypothetical protein K2I49_02975, partial [Ureaplasma sp.]|nr:hypothetical protein [Ureaplasma sp.]